MRAVVSGIYLIRNNITGAVYVGSSRDIAARWVRHKSELKYKRHHSKKLQRSWEKHGSENFSFEILEVIENDADVIPKEQIWIEALNAVGDAGYNIKPTAGRGGPQNEETRKRLSAMRTGRKLPPRTEEQRETMRIAKLGVTHSEETKLKMSKTRTGRKGPKPNLESRARMSASAKRRGISNEHKLKMKKGRENSTRRLLAKAGQTDMFNYECSGDD